MRSRGPIVTLLAIVVFGLILLAVNLSKSPTTGSAAKAAPAGAAQSAAAVAAPARSAVVPPPAAANPPAAAAAKPDAVAAPGAAAAPDAAAPDAAAPAAGGTQFPAAAKYTGYTDGNHAAIAVTVRDGKVSAYLCDGKAIESWYQGSASNGGVDAKGKGANALSGTLAGRTLTGTVSAGGKSWTYSAAPANKPAGLYRAKSDTRTTGWIKDSSGNVTGLAHDGDTVTPAGPLDPATAQSVEGGDRVVGQ
ncbi:MAG TPA: hypothetical protein VNP03_25580 [Pseudonocardia sp.]|nr:hypothetical protein [Pseudonocardia sp.]